MKFIVALVFSLTAYLAAAQVGLVRESLSVPSRLLGKPVEFSVFLPPDYFESTRSYPVLYLLHGFTDDETAWVQFGEADRTANRLMQAGEIPAMLIVMPDAGVSWYVNSADGSAPYEDFFVREFIPYIDSIYRTRPQKEFRAVAGLSMGGHGSLMLALKHAPLFAACAPLSAGVLTDDEVTAMPDDNWNTVFATPYGRNLKGKQRLSDHYKQNAALHLIQNASPDSLGRVRYYIDCGDEDFLSKGNMALHAALIDKKVPHEFRVRDGVHDWTYWRTALPDVLRFVGQSFRR